MVLERSELLALIERDSLLAELADASRAAGAGDPAHDLEHCLRVACWTVHIGQPAGVDRREAIAAALLHDIVNLPKSSPDRARASELCAARASELCAPHLSAPAVGRIAHAIRDHSYSRGARPQSPLGEALQDADRLEALGALGILRCISTGAKMGADYFDPDDPWAERRALDDHAHSVDHFYRKLLTVADTMCTDLGRAEAERRTVFLRAFLTQLSTELRVSVPPTKTPETPRVSVSARR